MKKIKNLIIGLLLLVMCSCAVYDNVNKNDPPNPPYGSPDDTVVYNGVDYKTITYVYNCYNGKYLAVSFTCTGNPSACYWVRSEHTSSCIE